MPTFDESFESEILIASEHTHNCQFNVTNELYLLNLLILLGKYLIWVLPIWHFGFVELLDWFLKNNQFFIGIVEIRYLKQIGWDLQLSFVDVSAMLYSSVVIDIFKCLLSWILAQHYFNAYLIDHVWIVKNVLSVSIIYFLKVPSSIVKVSFTSVSVF